MVMNYSIKCNSSSIHHHLHHHDHHHSLPPRKHRHNSRQVNLSNGLFYERVKVHHNHQQRQCYGNFVATKVLPLHMEAFSATCVTTLAAVAKRPADPMVLFQTSAVMIFFYLLSNFVVPQFLTKSMESEEEKETEKSNDTVSEDVGKPSSPSRNRGFNSTKPK